MRSAHTGRTQKVEPLRVKPFARGYSPGSALRLPLLTLCAPA
jgi:hypothetical protein